MSAPHHRRAVYRGLLSVCRKQEIEWLKRCQFGLDCAVIKDDPHFQLIRLAVRNAIREREAEVATRVAR